MYFSHVCFVQNTHVIKMQMKYFYVNEYFQLRKKNQICWYWNYQKVKTSIMNIIMVTIYKKNVDLFRYINLMFIRFDKKDNIQFYHININIFKLGVTGVYWLIFFLVKHKTSRNQKIHTLRKISKILCQKTPLTTRNIDTRIKCKRPCIKAFS